MLLAAALVLQDPAAVLADMQEALASASPIEVHATLSRTQALTWESHLAEGTVVADLERGTFRVDAAVRDLRDEVGRDVTLIRADGRYVFLDHAARTRAEGETPLLGGVASRMAYDLARILPAEPAHVADAGAPSLGEPLTLGGVPCRTLLAKTSDGPTAHVWYLASSDGLPRLWETTRELGAGDTLRKRMTIRGIGASPQGPDVALGGYAGYERREPAAWEDPEARGRDADAGSFTSLADGVGALREAFNADREHVRAIGLFAPS
jgi:hypothetical protein